MDFKWTDKKDGIDIVLSADINSIAHAIQAAPAEATVNSKFDAMNTKIENERIKSNEVYANNLNGSVSGTEIEISDISPNKHEVYVQCTTTSSSQEIQGLTVRRRGKNFLSLQNIDFHISGLDFTSENGELIINGASTSETLASNEIWKNNFLTHLKAGTYTFYAQNLGTSVINSIQIHDASNAILASFNSLSSENNVSFTIKEDTDVYLCFYIYNKSYDNARFRFQIELGNSFSNFEVSDVEILQTDSEGKVHGMTSLYPTMYIESYSDNIEIECYYNKDVNVVVNDINAKIGDIDTALTSVIDIQNNILGR